MNEEKEMKLLSLMAVGRSDGFWLRQRNHILARTSVSGRGAGRWLLVPAAALAAMLLFVARHRPEAPVHEVQKVEISFLENLDLLSDMDVLESIPEDKI